MKKVVCFLALFMPIAVLAQSDVLQWTDAATWYFFESDGSNEGLNFQPNTPKKLTPINARFGADGLKESSFVFGGKLGVHGGIFEQSRGALFGPIEHTKSAVMGARGTLAAEAGNEKQKLSVWTDFGANTQMDELGFARFGVRYQRAISEWLNVTAAVDKSHFGYGVRGLFLSRDATAHPFTAVQVNMGNVSVVNQFGFLGVNPESKTEIDYTLDGITASKENRSFYASHAVEWQIVDNLSLLLYDAVVWSAQDGEHYRGFEPLYLNPFGFYRSLEFSVGSSDNALLGMSAKWNTPYGFELYGSGLLDEFLLSEIKAGNGWWGNKFALQGGLRRKSKNTLLGVEAVLVRPFTYSHGKPGQAFVSGGRPLGAKFGAGYTESLVYGVYNKDNAFVRVQMGFAWQGLEEGADPSNNFRSSEYGHTLLGEEPRLILHFRGETNLLTLNSGMSVNGTVETWYNNDPLDCYFFFGVNISSAFGRYF